MVYLSSVGASVAAGVGFGLWVQEVRFFGPVFSDWVRVGVGIRGVGKGCG